MAGLDPAPARGLFRHRPGRHLSPRERQAVRPPLGATRRPDRRARRPRSRTRRPGSAGLRARHRRIAAHRPHGRPRRDTATSIRPRWSPGPDRSKRRRPDVAAQCPRSAGARACMPMLQASPSGGCAEAGSTCRTPVAGPWPGFDAVYKHQEDRGVRRRQIKHQGTRGRRGRHGDRTYQAVVVAASVMPSDSSQRSASMAALQPSAAAVTAWR